MPESRIQVPVTIDIKGVFSWVSSDAVHNYTILVLIKEGSMPDFHVKSLAALRVREGEEVDSLLSGLRPKGKAGHCQGYEGPSRLSGRRPHPHRRHQ